MSIAIAATEMDEDPCDFDGASGAARAEPELHHECCDCKTAYAFYSHLAYLLPDNTFAVNPDVLISSAVQKVTGQGFKNKYLKSGVRLVCYKCCEKLHEKVYVGVNNKLNSEWQNKQRSTKRSAVPKAKVRRILKDIEERAQRLSPSDTPAVTVSSVYDMLLQIPQVRAASDFVTEISPLMVMLYGCDRCKCYPLRSNAWFRCIKTGTDDDAEGLTAAGEKAGHWRCASCLKRWGWSSDGHKRLFVIGADDGDDDSQYFFAYIGNSSQKMENKINFVKTCSMLRKLGGLEVTKEALLQTISEINDKWRAAWAT